MYRNIIYNGYAGSITEFSWDQDGNPAEYSSYFKPYVYVETTSDKFDATSIFNTKLKKIEFKNERAKREFVDRNSSRRIFYNLPVKQQYLIEKYKDKSLEEMMKNPLRIFYLDIEVYSPDVFPEADQANFPINVITLGDSLTGKFYTWGLANDYNCSDVESIGIDPENIVYVNCSSEVNLLECFIRFWSRNYPDVITNWNGSTFDIPYLVNRINSLLGEDHAKKLSPNNFIYSKIKSNIFDKYYTHWVIDGIADIDYLELYAKFEPRQHESYKLDYVGNNEGIDGKVAYESANLAQLSDDDWNKFVTYNIQDVNIIMKLEDKKNYLKIARAKAYRGLSPLDKAMDSVPIVTGLIAKTALDDNKIIVTNRYSGESEEFDGGFVFKPTGKMHKGVVSFDVNSLYPNTMITLNTSPETKVGTVSVSGDTFIVRGINGKIKELNLLDFNKFIKDHNLVLTKANVLFSQKTMGICPKFLDDLYKDRVKIKSEMKTEKDSKKLEAMNLEQHLLKILLNSVYGVFGNKHFALYDVDIAKSVTLTGQAMIKRATEIVKEYSKEKLKDDNFDMESIVVYGDSVTGDTPIIIKDEYGEVKVVPIESITGNWESYDKFKPTEVGEGKEQIINPSFEVWSASGWTPAKRLIRHRTNKDIYRVFTNFGVVDVTEDHSLLLENGTPAPPKNVKVGTPLLHNSYKKTNNNSPMMYDRGVFVFNDKLELARKILNLDFGTYQIIEQLDGKYGLFMLDSRIEDTNIKKIYKVHENYSDFVYDIETEDGTFNTGTPIIVKNTDSCFFDFDRVLKFMNIPFFKMEGDSAEVTTEAYDVIKEYETTLNDRINKWAKSSLNSNDPRYKFSREKICYMGMFITKKNYILRVVDDEGSKCDKIVERGVELVKSSHSEDVKDIIREVIREIFYDKGKSIVDDLYIKGLDKFKSLPSSSISLRKNVKDHEKWVAMANGFSTGKGTPSHHRGSIFYNKLISDFGLGGKYPKITSGQKIKFLYLEPNKYGFKYICFPEDLPEEFGLSPDYNLQYNKMVSSLITRCYNGLDWIIPDLDNLKQTDLFEFLGLD